VCVGGGGGVSGGGEAYGGGVRARKHNLTEIHTQHTNTHSLSVSLTHTFTGFESFNNSMKGLFGHGTPDFERAKLTLG
jgi:hypothetical protein